MEALEEILGLHVYSYLITELQYTALYFSGFEQLICQLDLFVVKCYDIFPIGPVREFLYFQT